MKYYELIGAIDSDNLEIHIPNDIDKYSDINRPVLLISHELSRTGAPIQLLYLARALEEIGFAPVVFSIKEGQLMEEFLISNYIVSYPTKGTVDTVWLNTIASLFEIIFANTLALAPFIRFLAPITSKIYWWIHENSYWYKKEFCENIPDFPSLHVLGASPKTLGFIDKFMGVKAEMLNVCTLDYGYHISNKKKEKTTFLWAGSLDGNKAIDVFFEAILDLTSNDRNKSVFIVCGNKTAGDDYYELTRKFASSFSNILFFESMAHDELMVIMEEVDAVVISSLEETTSMVASEGLMKGKIVICSDGCGITDYMSDGENGFVFPSRDHMELSSRMSKVINRESCLTDLRYEARKVFEKYYSFERFAQSLREILSEND